MRCRPATRATPMLNSSSIRLRRRESVSLGHFQNCNLLEMDHFRRHGVEDELGIPTVLDRFVQQAVQQVLQKQWDPTFSEHSYGFRPGRSAQQAVAQAQRYTAEG